MTSRCDRWGGVVWRRLVVGLCAGCVGLAAGCATTDPYATSKRIEERRLGDGLKGPDEGPARPDPEQAYGLTRDTYNLIRAESLTNGTLDFGKDLDDARVYMLGGVRYRADEAGMVLWGKAVRARGVRDADAAVALYEDVRKVTLSPAQKDAVRFGFMLQR